MKIVVFGATGNIGRRIVKEALDRGHHVTGVVREPARVDTPDERLTLPPALAAVLMSASTVIVAIHAHLLRRVRL
jgi:putative NADH-flavin reductase